jgi:hypothetical protein
VGVSAYRSEFANVTTHSADARENFEDTHKVDR